jgi:hypothetical protein
MSARRGVKKSASPGHTTKILLHELVQTCEAVLKLIHQLEVPGLTTDKREEILGKLSAEITHLHEHTRGLDEKIIEEDS